jgi:peptidoglycan/LPS O-acetylase OafA/YrhL
VIVASFFTTLPVIDFFSSKETYRYLWLNGSLYQAEYNLPGVVYSASQKHGAAVNGSIWSLFAEVRLYLIVAIAGAFGVVGRRLASNTVLALIILVGLIEPGRLPFMGEDQPNWRLAGFFAAGSFAYINRYSIPLNFGIFSVLLLSAILSAHSPNFVIASGAALAYGTLFLGLSKKLPLPGMLNDYSYGIYLYGWPASQLVAHFFPSLGPKGLTAIALPASWILGFISWNLIEERALNLRRKTPSGAPTLRSRVDHSALLKPAALAQDDRSAADNSLSDLL